GKEVGNTSTWHYNAIRDLNSDPIFAWYDPLHWDSICRLFSGLVSVLQGVELNLELKLDFGVKMNLAIDIMNHKDVDEYKLLVALENGFELDDQLKMDFESRSRAVLMLIRKESSATETKLPAQECDSSEKCSCSCDCLL
ncbi:hypothetical protein S245_065681, partial [Arachis hypogaea]